MPVPNSPVRNTNPRRQHRARAQALGLVLGAALCLNLVLENLAFAYLGQGIIGWARDYIIAPVGLLSVIVAMAASIFRPDFVKSAAYAAVVCAALFLVISQANTVLSALQQ